MSGEQKLCERCGRDYSPSRKHICIPPELKPWEKAAAACPYSRKHPHGLGDSHYRAWMQGAKWAYDLRGADLAQVRAELAEEYDRANRYGLSGEQARVALAELVDVIRRLGSKTILSEEWVLLYEVLEALAKPAETTEEKSDG